MKSNILSKTFYVESILTSVLLALRIAGYDISLLACFIPTALWFATVTAMTFFVVLFLCISVIVHRNDRLSDEIRRIKDELSKDNK